jgi:hypothetical protein
VELDRRRLLVRSQLAAHGVLVRHLRHRAGEPPAGGSDELTQQRGRLDFDIASSLPGLGH